jgi:hypothetical protein
MGRPNVGLHVTALLACVVLELPAHLVEGLSRRQVHILVGPMSRRISGNDERLARNGDLDAYPEVRALPSPMMLAGILDPDVAAREAWIEPLQLGRSLADERVERSEEPHEGE